MFGPVSASSQSIQGETHPGIRKSLFGDFLKCWYPTTIGFPTKNDHFGVFWGYHHLRKHPFGSEGLVVKGRMPSRSIYLTGKNAFFQSHISLEKNIQKNI